MNYDLEKENDPSSSSLLVKSSHTLENGITIAPNVSFTLYNIVHNNRNFSSIEYIKYARKCCPSLIEFIYAH